MASTVEIVRAICKEKRIPVSRLEQDLGYGNGYLNPKKASSIPSNRLAEIARYLNTPIDRFLGAELECEQEKNPAPTNGDGMSEDEKEIIRLFRSVDPATRAAMLQLLRAAEAGQITQDAGEAKK